MCLDKNWELDVVVDFWLFCFTHFEILEYLVNQVRLHKVD